MDTVSTLLEQLRQIKTCFGPDFAKGKISLLNQLHALPIQGKNNLQNYHDLLLFMMAYPDNVEVLKLLRKEIGRLINALAEMEHANSFSFHQKFDQSGVAFSTTALSPSLDAGSWMLRTFPSAIELQIDSDFQKAIGEILPLLCLPAEQDGLTDDRFDTTDWLELAAGDKSETHKKLFKWIIEKINRLKVDKKIKDYLLEKIGVNIQFKLSQPGSSVTDHFLEPAGYFMQKSLLLKDFKVLKKINSKNCKVNHLENEKAIAIINSAKTVLAARGRETDPVTYADKVIEVIVERGLVVYLLSMKYDSKLPIENYTGFVAYRNGVPIGYGGGWIFFDRCEIGVNIFETFRGGENSLIFTIILRVYNQVFGIKKFVVPPYQFGEDNEEGLQSGAFWFYYKLGFKPADEEIAKIAEREFFEIKKSREYRSPLRVLKKLTLSPMILLNGKCKTDFEPKHLSIALSRWIYKEFNGNEHKASDFSRQYFFKFFSKNIINHLSQEELYSCKAWAPLITMSLKIEKLDATEKNEILKLLKSKASDEMAFSLLLKKNNKLTSAFRKIASREMAS